MFKKYIERKQLRENTPAMLLGGKWYRYVAGNWISEKDFDAVYPPILNPLGKKENSDKTKQYLYD